MHIPGLLKTGCGCALRVIRFRCVAAARLLKSAPPPASWRFGMFRFRSRRIAAAALTGLLSLVSASEAASPRLSIVMPRGGQRGVEAEFTFSGSLLQDAQEILFFEPGFEVRQITPVDANNFKAKVFVKPDARIGEHICHVRTATGVSDFRTVYVGYLPLVPEVEPNSDFAAPQVVALNSTVTGIVQNEDVDYFIVEAKKGQRIAVEVEAMRLGTTLFDPYVAILDAKRFELASADDTPLVVQDATASAVAPEDGKYIIEVRESSYAGNGACNYRLHVGTFPRPTAVYPAGGPVGQEVDLRFLGDAAGEFSQKFKLPDALIADYGVLPGPDGNWAPSANPFRLSSSGNSLEIEPNNALAEATPAELPNAFNGIIQSAGDADYFKFTAKAGQQYEVECYGRRIRSAVDPVMYLYNAQGGAIASNDDSRGPDSYFRFGVPADGEYVLMVTDHLKRGGPDFVYRVEFQPIQPRLELSIPRTEQYGQYRQQIYVARGNRFGALLNAGRLNFGGQIQLSPPSLPPGVTLHSDVMPAGMSQMPVVFEAAPDAPTGGLLVDLSGVCVETPTVTGGFTNTSDFIVSGPGQSIYYRKTVNRVPVVVCDELPFKVELVPPKSPLARNGSMQLKVVLTRKEGFNDAVTVIMPFAPPGVGVNSSITIPAGAVEGSYPINANGGAALGEWKFFCLATAAVNGGAAWSSSALTPVTVAEPFVTFAMGRTACEQGQETEIACKLTHGAAAFEGDATVQLFGLPNKVEAEVLKFKKETAEVVFKVKTDKISPVGRHGNVFAQVSIPVNGETVVHVAGSTELRIDAPLPPKVEAPKPAPAPMATAAAPATPMPAAAPAPARRLTRLEQLRLDKAKQAGGGM